MSNQDKSRVMAAAAVVSLLASGALLSQSASAAEQEKCAGIAAAGKNDCGTPVSSCTGTAKENNEKYAWVLVPKGTCSKIAGGMVTTDPMDRHGGKGG